MMHSNPNDLTPVITAVAGALVLLVVASPLLN